ncbi:hypothetical protein [Micromonospora coerulea]|uniref:hypothetical protein n=1 Tax=Micromonospora coerulea TaxID=47856 RepID=UPI001908DEC2|nr:hypothetical protein [Micromonospora veneta]
MAGNAEDMITLTSAEQDLSGSNLWGATAPDVVPLERDHVRVGRARPRRICWWFP